MDSDLGGKAGERDGRDLVPTICAHEIGGLDRLGPALGAPRAVDIRPACGRWARPTPGARMGHYGAMNAGYTVVLPRRHPSRRLWNLAMLMIAEQNISPRMLLPIHALSEPVRSLMPVSSGGSGI